jgi:transposase
LGFLTEAQLFLTLLCVAGVKILDLIADGVTDAQTLASSVSTKIKRKEDAKKALTNCLTAEHIFVIRELMTQYRDIAARILHVDDELAEKMKPYARLIEELKKIPGIDRVLAMGILAEATADMSSFADERKFAAWAGVASGNNESAGKKKNKMQERQSSIKKTSRSGRTRRENETRNILSRQFKKASIP